MSNKKSEKLKSAKSKISNTVQSNITRALIFLAIVLCMVFCMASMLKYTQFKNELQRLQSEVSSIQEGVVTVREETQTEQTISYLETEMTRHREFIESQENRLVWLVGIIGSFAVVLLAYVGLENRRAIKQTVREQYDDAVSEVVGEMIGSKENEQYLKQAVMAERKAKTTKILFLYWDDQNMKVQPSRKRLNSVEEEMYKAGFDVSRKQFGFGAEQKDFERLIRKSNVIVYEVNPDIEDIPSDKKDEPQQRNKSSEGLNQTAIQMDDVDQAKASTPNKQSDSEDKIYKKEVFKSLVAACHHQQKNSILYFEGPRLSGFYTMKEKEFVAISNMCLTLKQMLYSILYH